MTLELGVTFAPELITGTPSFDVWMRDGFIRNHTTSLLSVYQTTVVPGPTSHLFMIASRHAARILGSSTLI